ncbi:MAG: hypothetical protein SGJ19_04795 [Planctomycetia bacterium]|nr:hypothetical protein [Planctomycetia bacterium]
MIPPEPNSPLEIERQRNRATAEAWSLYAEHRAIVTEQLAQLGDDSRDRSLCVFGAGNLNDVELRWLLPRFAGIDLVDCDAEAMRRGLEHQSLASEPAIRAIGPIDLSGLLSALPSTADVQALIHAATSTPIELPRADYDVIASLCLLSQLVDQAARALGPDHPRLLDLIQAVRQRHLRLLAEQLRPGGAMLLVTDFVSSDTCPKLLTLPAADIPSAARNWLHAGNFFTGVNPLVLRRALTNDPEIAPSWTNVKMVRPWRWQLSARRAYAVCALTAIRSYH